MSYLLDTNVVSELVATRPNPKVTDWLDGVEPDQVFLSVITVGELKGGIDRLPNSKRRQRLSDWLNGDLLVRFGERVLTDRCRGCACLGDPGRPDARRRNSDPGY